MQGKPAYKKLNLYLIKPSKYDDDGYVIRHWKGVLPSNTLLSRRESFPLESRFRFLKRRIGDFTKLLLGWIKLALEMEEVWLATRKRGVLEEQVVREMSRIRNRVDEWRNIKLSELQSLYRQAAEKLERSAARKPFPRLVIPSRFRLWMNKGNVFSDSLTFTRRPLTQFWKEVFSRFKRGRIDLILFPQVAFASFRESILFLRFIVSVLRRSVYTETVR